ncbi:MAG: monovalent cation/H(+) antiporter subunit G [Salinisphaeraceae bacterium]|nr:monovalent cation/H(+) antiporter subunit G [Salinisphaeraceae bacterium]
MLALTLDILSWLCILAGSAFAVIGGIGMHRLPDFFSRSHAASITDTGGAGLIILGLLLQSPAWIVAIKLLMILLFLWFTSPTASNILAQAALADGLKPQAKRDNKGRH